MVLIARVSHFVSLLLLIASVSVVSSSSSAVHPNVGLANRVVEWVQQNGGYFDSAKLEFQYDDTSGLVLKAIADIDEDTELFTIPRKLLIKGDNMCHLAQVLSDEMNALSEISSYYEPYLTYLNHTQSRNFLPATWSEAGKDLLLEMLTDGYHKQVLPPKDVLSHSVVDECFAAPELEHFYMLVIARGWDHIMIRTFYSCFDSCCILFEFCFLSLLTVLLLFLTVG